MDDAAPMPFTPPVQQVLDAGNASTTSLIIKDTADNTQNEYTGRDIKQTGPDGRTLALRLKQPLVDGVVLNTPELSADDTIALVSDITTINGTLDNKADLVGGLVPASQLPAYVDDVLEFANLSAFPATGESGKIYIALDTNKTYRWGGSDYVVISDSLALGETSSTAYRGDRGKIAYDHSQIVTGNPHNTAIGDISGLSAALAPISGKLTGTAATDAETQITATVTEDNKFISRLKLFNWWTWVKGQAQTFSALVNFTGGLKKGGVDVATVTDVAGKLNTTGNTGLAGTGIRLPKVAADGTIMVDGFLTWLSATREVVIGSTGNPGKINIFSSIFELAVQDNILSGQSRFLLNANQDDALSFVDKSGNIYMTFRTTTGGVGVILKQREIFDQGLFYPINKIQASITSAGAAVEVYGKDALGNVIAIPFTVDTMVMYVEATLLLKNSTASIVISSKVKAMVKKVSGTVTVTPSALDTLSSNPSYPTFLAGIKMVGTNLQFYFTPMAGDTTAYTGVFTEIKYTIN